MNPSVFRAVTQCFKMIGCGHFGNSYWFHLLSLSDYRRRFFDYSNCEGQRRIFFEHSNYEDVANMSYQYVGTQILSNAA